MKEMKSDSRTKPEQRGKYALGALVTVTALAREESFIKAAHDCYILALLSSQFSLPKKTFKKDRNNLAIFRNKSHLNMKRASHAHFFFLSPNIH